MSHAEVCGECNRLLPDVTRIGPWEPFVPEPGQGTGVIGKSGEGKSTGVKEWEVWLLNPEGEHEHEPQSLFWFDTHDEHSIHGRPRELAPLGPLSERMMVAEFLKMMRTRPADFINKPHVSLSVVPENPDDFRGVAQQFLAVAPHVKNRGHLIFGIEEVGEWGHFAEDMLRAIATGWRKEGVAGVFMSQEWMDFPTRVRGQMRKLRSYRQGAEQSLRGLSSELGRDVACEVAALPEHGSILVDLERPRPKWLEGLNAGEGQQE